MRLKIFFTKNSEPVPSNNQGFVNSYVHKCLGNNNKYHDDFSDYNISHLIGRDKVIGKSTTDFSNGGMLVVSSESETFLNELLTGIMSNTEIGWSMKYSHMEFINEKFYDGLNHFSTVSPILLSESTGKKTRRFHIHSDGNYDEILTMRTLIKLNAINTKQNLKLNLNGFKITTTKGGWETSKDVMVKNVKNIASTYIATVKCTKKVARVLYNVGLGQSTGSGFGTICKVENRKQYVL